MIENRQNRVDVLNTSTHFRRLRGRGLQEQKDKGSETCYLPTESLIVSWHPLLDQLLKGSN